MHECVSDASAMPGLGDSDSDTDDDAPRSTGHSGVPFGATEWLMANFTDEQQVTWRKAEVTAGIGANRGPKSCKNKTKTDTDSDSKALVFVDGFAGSDVYKGPHVGYCFRLGHKGQGYYHDKQPAAVDPVPSDAADTMQQPDEPPEESASRSSRKRNDDGT